MSAAAALLSTYTDKVNWNPALDDNGYKRALQDTSWADGLRGIAAVFVMFSHLTIAFARWIVIPCHGKGGLMLLMQRPIFRLVGQGAAWVALFFILSGFVNSLKPVKLARAGSIEPALSNLAVSSFRRSFRLVLPATAATILSWLITQFGAYETAQKSDAYWLYTTSPNPSSSWVAAVDDLLRAIRTTWMYNPDNPYDQPQWALLYLLQGSMFVFTALLATINLTPRWRVFTMIFLYLWAWNWGIRLGDPMVGVNVFTGILLAELNHSDLPLRFARSSRFFAPPLAVCGLFLMSFPSQFQDWAHWSDVLLRWHYKIAPANAEIARFWPTIGAQILTSSIVMSPHLRRLLSHRWLLWLGKISFPLYLLHGSFMRSILAWLLFSRQQITEIEEEGKKHMRYPLPGTPTFLVVMPIFFITLFTATHFWAIKIEPYFGIITKTAEEIMFGKSERGSALPVRKD
ncbi:MAG: hypothetical protein LQ346_001444 [Caloplaca aetnensis]|nr:MAG: hypothetical protein LQ346_001444 [Caloplaca aetnensis]